MGNGVRRLFLCLALALVFLPFPAAAQSLRDQLRNLAEADHLGHSVQSIAIFGGTPGISAANYQADALRLQSYKLPVSHHFAPLQGGMLTGIAPYTELTLGHARVRQQADIATAGTVEQLKLKYRSWSALAAAGGDIPLDAAGKTVLRPMLLAGYSRVNSDAAIGGPLAPILEAEGRGIINDAHLATTVAGAALALAHEQHWQDDIRLSAHLRFNQLVTISQDASDRALHADGGFGVATGGAELNGPLPFTLGTYPTRWITFTSATWLTGARNDMLGFNSFIELGGGLELVTNSLGGRVEGISFRLSGLIGEGVRGGSMGVSLEF